MRKYILFLIIPFLFCCRTNDKAIKLVSKIPFKSDSIVFWKIDSLTDSEYYNVKELMPLTVAKNRFLINKGKLYNKNEKTVVSDLTLQLRVGELYGQDVYIFDGLPIGLSYEFRKSQADWKLINYNNLGNLDGIFVVGKYETKFNNGIGYWKDFYYIDYKDLSKILFILKEEGEVKNNFKYGEWKYYNKSGIIDSTKTYSLKDSVDVRFPHCIFNKKEPCYCEKK